VVKLNKRGAILLIVLIVILTISLLGATLVALFSNVMTASQVELYRMKALYLAEAGIAKAVEGLRGQAGAQGKFEGQLGGGSFKVETDLGQSIIVSTGISNGVRRTVQIKYAAL
jgi:hypothetical protein